MKDGFENRTEISPFKKKFFFSFFTVILGILNVSDYKYETMSEWIFILKKTLL